MMENPKLNLICFLQYIPSCYRLVLNAADSITGEKWVCTKKASLLSSTASSSLPISRGWMMMVQQIFQSKELSPRGWWTILIDIVHPRRRWRKVPEQQVDIVMEELSRYRWSKLRSSQTDRQEKGIPPQQKRDPNSKRNRCCFGYHHHLSARTLGHRE